MKTPKEPKTFKRPRLYWAPLDDLTSSGRMRVIYPNGNAEWSPSNGLSPRGEIYEAWAKDPCCWAYSWPYTNVFGELSYDLKFTSGHQALIAMREYDQDHGYPPAEFLGEL